MKDKKSKKLKAVIIILAILLAVSAAALTGTLLYHYFSPSEPASVEVPGNIITPDSENTTDTKNAPTYADSTNDETSNQPNASATSETEAVPESNAVETTSVNVTKASAISLHNRKPEDNTPFQVSNMFPGDRETKYYCIKVSYKGDIIVRYRADIRDGYEKLAEVLKVKICLLDTNETLYDGLMRDMPKSLNHALYTNTSTQSELYYAITTYLDTSVGNEYMNKDLIADFHWWVEETDRLDSPQTGDTSNIYLWICLASGSLILMLILLAKRRKEAADEQ